MDERLSPIEGVFLYTVARLGVFISYQDFNKFFSPAYRFATNFVGVPTEFEGTPSEISHREAQCLSTVARLRKLGYLSDTGSRVSDGYVVSLCDYLDESTVEEVDEFLLSLSPNENNFKDIDRAAALYERN